MKLSIMGGPNVKEEGKGEKERKKGKRKVEETGGRLGDTCRITSRLSIGDLKGPREVDLIFSLFRSKYKGNEISNTHCPLP